MKYLKVIFAVFCMLSVLSDGLAQSKKRSDLNEAKHSATSGTLYEAIAHLDSLQFAAFNARNIEQLKVYFDSSLELYQDNTGLRNYRETVEAFTELFKKNYTLTRKLIPGSMEVYPIKDFGAIETGRHTFTHIENGKRVTGEFKFMQIWKNFNGRWTVTREITYDH